ncbi:probable G-protein coupled receptor Mth-like 3 [Apis florea]|uniref:probable G-protein coupled receptor Mth-like 3 n=1 Tax=Apis florea TaxID=7463 RepID=UPI0012FE9670|nr:probable G-protein coupled receptor Mth-like 3 [Apis florea]
MTTTRHFMIVLLLIDVSYAFNKCCPSGGVFTSNLQVVNCFPTPSDATELSFVDFNEDNGYPIICDQPEYITTTPLNQFNFTNFVQKPFCIEILHEQSTPLNVPILVHCESNEDRNKMGQLSSEFLPKPRFLNITRCCSNNQVFNLTRGTCESSMNEDDFLTLFPKDELRSRNIDIVSIGKRLLKCPTSTAMFTYEIDAADVTILDESLKVNVWKNQIMESFTITGRNSCLEVTPDFRSRRRIAVRVCRDEHVCRGDNCVKKCCKHGSTKSLCEMNKKHELNFYDEISNITGTPRNITEYGVMFKMIKCSEFYLEPMENLFGVTSEGELKLLPDKLYLPQDIYCLDVISRQQDNYEEKLYAFICFPDTTLQDNIRIIVITTLGSISFICLLLTLTVYACLPVLQNLHGKTLMSHVASLMVGYFCISISPWLKDIEQSYVLCSFSGILLFFSFLSAFSWLNVMCFDIWRTFGRLQGNLTRPRKHGKRFLSYCLYAWGLPIFITAFAFLDDYVHILPENLRPHFNKQNCWFETNLVRHGEILYFRSVVMIQLIINIVFFILTAKQYSMVKAEIKKVTMDSSDPRNKQFLSNKSKFIMNVKLFIVMGIPWITEMISSMIRRYTFFVYEQEFFYMTDVFNCLQGLLIFILFVIKRRVCEALKKRLGLDEKKKFSQTAPSLQDPFKIRKSVSNSTLTSTFAISSIP